MLILLLAALWFAPAVYAQVPTAAPAPITAQASSEDAPLPAIDGLLHDVERNQEAADEARKDYTYH
ncbi:MAG: hypothetical protein ABI142_03205, partial [Bryocella sp.]